MITIKTLWFYAALAAALGGGVGIGAYVSPSQADLERALRQAQEAQVRDCDSGSDRAFRKGEFQNSRGQGF